MRFIGRSIVAALAFTLFAGSAFAQARDVLSSWNEGPARQAIVAFVDAVTTAGSPDFVPPAERIAVFDNDGTLWPEQPLYVQLAFALDRVRDLAPANPDWKDRPPFSAVLANDEAGVVAAGQRGLVDLVMATHTGMTTDDFAGLVESWLARSRHPRFGRPYTDLAYRPMLEVLQYLQGKGFRTVIVSGGGVEFMRPWTPRVYGVAAADVIGSSVRTRFEMKDGRPVLVRLPELNFFDDGPGKPVAINLHVGARPIAAFGNSDGDLQMLQWVTMSGRRSLGVIVRHTDAVREYAYDRQSPVGRLDKALDAAGPNGWVVVSMKDDWKRIFAFEP
ncbi:HAD family hydrolase [Alsobacter sp. R-9]